jgi:hypothetical protein
LRVSDHTRTTAVAISVGGGQPRSTRVMNIFMKADVMSFWNYSFI